MNLPEPRHWRQLLDATLARGKYRRLIEGRFFHGFITSVSRSGAQYLCGVQRVGEARADGNAYLCVTPGYAPAVGDLVECMWRDANVAYVLLPVNGTNTVGPAGRWHAEVWLSGTVSLTNNTDIKLAFDNIEGNPAGLWDATNHNFTLPPGVTGRVLVTCTIQATATGLLKVFVNNGEAKRGSQSTAGTSTYMVTVVVRVTASGQAVDIRFNNQAAAANCGTGQNITWAQFTYLGPL